MGQSARSSRKAQVFLFRNAPFSNRKFSYIEPLCTISTVYVLLSSYAHERSVESRKGARPGTAVSRLFPFPAHELVKICPAPESLIVPQLRRRQPILAIGIIGASSSSRLLPPAFIVARPSHWVMGVKIQFFGPCAVFVAGRARPAFNDSANERLEQLENRGLIELVYVPRARMVRKTGSA